MNHLTDEDIQAYLDRNLKDTDSGLKAHLARCEQCRNAVREYRMLYAGLAAEPGFMPPADLAQAVIDRLELRRPEARHVLSGDLVLTGVSIAVAIVVAIWLIDLRPLIDAIAAFRTPLAEQASPSLASARGYLLGLNHTLAFLGLGLLILLITKMLGVFLPRNHPLSTRR